MHLFERASYQFSRDRRERKGKGLKNRWESAWGLIVDFMLEKGYPNDLEKLESGRYFLVSGSLAS